MSLRMTPFANVKTVQNLKSFKMSNCLKIYIIKYNEIPACAGMTASKKGRQRV